LPEGTPIGDYRLQQMIGTGSMGEVYEARHVATQRKAAIKVLRVDAEEAHNAAQRLVEEARAAIAIRHPGIVQVTDLGIYRERPYMVMELLNGLPLGVQLKQRLMTVPEAIHVLDGILDALSAAHRAGVVHRDLKPSNVFLVTGAKGQGPRVKLLDFGVARRAQRREALTSPAVAIGSAGFMAPEQLLGQAVASSDLYAVGCIAFLLLTGKPVFPLKNIPDNARAHFQEPPPKLRPLRAEITPQLEAWVLRLLSKKPVERHASALIALNDLRYIIGATQPGLGEGDDASSSRTEVVKAFVPTVRPAPSVSVDDDDDDTTVAGRPGDSDTTGVVRTPQGPGSTIVEDS
jgi:serine/threonine-protein kinase